MESKCLTAVISIDLNDLKRLNDENGHAAGDTALCTIVACIQNILPRDATCIEPVVMSL